MESLRRRATIAAGLFGSSLLNSGCSVSIEPTELTQACLERFSAAALAESQTWPIAANIAGRVGFGPPRGLDAPPIQTKQVGFLSADGAQHSVAFENAEWSKALLIRIANEGGRSRVRLYTIDRQGRLIGAGEGYNGQAEIFRLDDPRVRDDYRNEQNLWRVMGPDEECGRG